MGNIMTEPEGSCILSTEESPVAQENKSPEVFSQWSRLEDDTPLLCAVNEGDVSKVECLLRQGFNINLGLFTPLFHAIANLDLKMVDFLISKGASVNHIAIYGITPLSFACAVADLEIINSLIAAGADINTKEDSLDTLLHIAVEQNDHSLVNALLSRGLNVNAVNIKKVIPLHLAVYNRNLELVQTLVAHGSDVNAACEDYENTFTPLMLAIHRDEVGIVKVLIEAGANVNEKTNPGYTPLFLACEDGLVEIVEVLLNANADINGKADMNSVFITCNDITPLHIAVIKNRVEVIKLLLLRADIDVNANFFFIDDSGLEPRRKRGGTALHSGVVAGNLDVVKMLVRKKADINALTSDGSTPLGLAVHEGHFEVYCFLIKSGANICAKNPEKWTSFLHAVDNDGPLKIIRRLVAKGANMDAKTNGGLTILHLAAIKNRLELVNILSLHGALVNVKDNNNVTPLHFAALNGNLEMVKYLLDSGGDPNIGTKRKVTPLHISAGSGYLNLTELLLEKGANVNVVDHKNHTPLHNAAQKGSDHIASILLKYGADVTVRESKNKHTALHVAILNSHPDVVKVLAANGADVNERDDSDARASPLYLAVVSNNLDIVRILLSNGACLETRLFFVRPLLQKLLVDNYLTQIADLFRAVGNNDVQLVQKFIKEGVFTDARNSQGCTPLHRAVNNGNTEIVALLLNGADPTVVTKEGNTALHIAVLKGFGEIVQLLLQNDKIKEFINVGTVCTNTSLHIAAENGSIEIVKSLLEHGAMYDIFNKKGKKPCDVSTDEKVTDLLKFVNDCFEDVSKGNSDVTEKLKVVEHDILVAVINACNSNAKTLLQISIDEKHTHITSELLSMILKNKTNV